MARNPLEETAEITLVGKPAGPGNLLDAQGRILKMALGQRDPFITNEIGEAFARFGHKKVGKIIRRAMDLPGQFFDRE